MFIAIVDVEVAPQDRESALSLLKADSAGARKMAGNLSYRAFADLETATGIRIFHEWDSKAAFDAYTQTELFERIGEQLKPLLAAPPVSRRLTAELFETRRN